MNVAKFLNTIWKITIFCHYSCFFIATERIVSVVHDGFEVIRYISTVNANVTVFVKSKSIFCEKRITL